MRYLMLLMVLFCSLAYADNESVPTQIVDAGVVLTAQNIDTIEQDKSNQQGRISNFNFGLNNANTAIANDNASESQLQQSLLALASQNPPIPSAVNICNSNPAKYCPGWVIPTPPAPPALITSPSGVNWDLVALLNGQGANWQDIQSEVTGVNWYAINQANGINWSSVNKTGINWNDWTNQEAQGVNWSQWILNGGQ